jgi:hypothetical protein
VRSCAALAIALAVLTGVAAPGSGSPLSARTAPTPETIAGVPVASVPSALRQPFAEYEAENAVHDGSVVGPDRRFGTLPAEASGRRAVMLSRPGNGVTFRLSRAANALVVRYAIADSADRGERNGSIGVYVDGRRIASLPVTSRYGWFYGKYPFSNDPADGRGHHFFDHSRLLLERPIPAGTAVRLAFEPTDGIDWIAIDLADFELVPPPPPPPPNALLLTDFGADPTGTTSSTQALTRAVAAATARMRPLWIPPGRYRIDGHITLDKIEIVGAGMWRSVLFGDRIGLYGRTGGPASRNVRLRDFAIIGDVRERVDTDQVNAIGGAMSDSRIERLWLQHVKVGLWFDGPMDNIRVSGLRIFDVTADGLNFHRSVSNAVIERSFIRGTGDDGLAAWAGGGQNSAIAFRDNVVVAPVLANGIAVYGGRDIVISGNLIADTLTEGGGIHIGNRFDAVPVAGTIRIDGNIIVRGGSFDPRWKFGVGALWFYALDAPIAAHILVSRLTISDSSEDAILFLGKSVSHVAFSRLRVRGAGGPVFTMRSPGSADATDLRADGVRIGLRRCDKDFRLTIARSPGFPAPADRACAPGPAISGR